MEDCCIVRRQPAEAYHVLAVSPTSSVCKKSNFLASNKGQPIRLNSESPSMHRKSVYKNSTAHRCGSNIVRIIEFRGFLLRYKRYKTDRGPRVFPKSLQTCTPISMKMEYIFINFTKQNCDNQKITVYPHFFYPLVIFTISLDGGRAFWMPRNRSLFAHARRLGSEKEKSCCGVLCVSRFWLLQMRPKLRNVHSPATCSVKGVLIMQQDIKILAEACEHGLFTQNDRDMTRLFLGGSCQCPRRRPLQNPTGLFPLLERHSLNPFGKVGLAHTKHLFGFDGPTRIRVVALFE